MIHVVSDLFLNYLDHAVDQHLLDTSVKYIIITGNISHHNKRSGIYIDRIAEKFPNSNVIYNPGVYEAEDSIAFETTRSSFNTRINILKNSPKNLYYPRGQVIGNFDFYCATGWPVITKDIDFKDSYIHNHLNSGTNTEFYIGDRLITKTWHTAFTIEHLNNIASQEEIDINKWLSTDSGYQKILISSLGDWSRYFIGSSEYKIFPNINLNNLNWICGGDYNFVGLYRGANVICLPGRDRSKYISLESFTNDKIPNVCIY